MNFIRTAAIGASAIVLTFGSAAFAQVAGNGAPQQGPTAPAPETSAPAAPGATTNVSDVEVKQFAKTAVALQEIRADTTATDADKQAKMAAAVQQSGLTPERFNQIAQAASSDSALMQRIQLAANEASEPATP